MRPPATDLLVLALLSVIYLALELPTLRAVGILWDEQNDITVARSYVSTPAGWLAGSDEDPTQLRLPMYTVAAAFRLLGRTDLYVARLVSCLVSILTLLAVYVYGRRFGRAQALLAAALVATSPFFLAFSRVALTEGDAFVTAAIAWTIVSLAAALDHPTVRRTALSGVALGLAISSKFVAVALLPAIVLVPWVVNPSVATDRRDRRNGALFVLGSACVLAWELLTLVWFYSYRPPIPEHAGLVLFVWSCAAAVYAVTLLWLLRFRQQTLGRASQPTLVALVAGATFILLPPVHLTSPVHLGSLKDMALDSAGVDPVFILQSMSLHAMTLLFKPGIAVGILLWVALAMALWRWRIDPRVRLPLLAIATYAAFLVKMPVAQTFYTMPVFPWLVVLAADRLTALLARKT